MIKNLSMKKLLLILVFLNFTSLTFADSSEPFLKGVKDIVKLEFSYGRSYEGQVEECLISGKKTMCFKGLGIYTFQTGYRYKGEFNDNKPNGQGVLVRQMVSVMRVSLKMVNSVDRER